MTTTEIHTVGTDLGQQMDYARAVASGGLLPQAYRGKPADILIAIGLGQAMGLSPAESLYRIDVIQGKPTASAELIAANVRKAGHKLRVKGDDTSCTATIIRADDPDFPFEVTRDTAWANRMGLTSKDNYKKQPGTMLQWRAISGVARLACPEALYGVAYTPDEMSDLGDRSEAQRVTVADIVSPSVEDVHDAEVVEDEPNLPVEPQPMTQRARGRMFALFNEQGMADAATDQGRRVRLAYIAHVIGRPIESSSELTADEGAAVIRMLESDGDH